MERLDGRHRPRRKQMERVPFPLDFEELPNRPRLHEAGCGLLHFLDIMKQLERFRIARRQQLFEVAFETEMAAIKHERIDVAPDFREMRDRTHTTVQIRRRRDRNRNAHLRASLVSYWYRGRL